MSEKRLDLPMADRTRSLFSRLIWVTWSVISGPRKFFSTYKMDDSRWVSYLYGSTLCGLVFVFLHTYSMVSLNTLPETTTQLILMVMLDYFSILLFLPIFLMVLQFLFEISSRIAGLPFQDKNQRRTMFNVLSYSLAAVVFTVLPVAGNAVALILFLVFAAAGIKKNWNVELWKIIFSLGSVLAIAFITARYWLFN